MEQGTPLSFEEVKAEVQTLPLTTAKRFVLPGSQFRPSLPLPKKLESGKRRISFVKSVTEVKMVADYLFKDENADPSLVGEKEPVAL
jgi:hypothetical protein